MKFNGEKTEYAAHPTGKFKKGRNSLEFLQEEGEGYFCLISNSLPSKRKHWLEADVLKSSPVFYKVKFSGWEKQDLLFVLNESFDEGWEAFYCQENGKYNKIPAHFLANGYANGWHLDMRGKNRHDIVIVLKYAHQRGFTTGLLIAALTLTVCTVAFIFRNKLERSF